MALSFNSATKKWERSPTTAPVASSIPTAPAPVKTPVTYAQQTDPAKAKISSIGTQTGGTPTTTVPTTTTAPKPVTTTTPTTPAPKSVTPAPTPGVMQPGQQEAYDFIGGPKQTTTPTQPTGTTQPTTPELGAPAQDERIGQSKSEEQALQDNIDKTQEELMNLRNREDALGQAEYLKKTKELQEYQAKQKEITDKQKAMSEEQAQIQSSAKLREAQRSLSQLKRNTAYLSSQGLGQSAGALDAFSEQISNSEQIFKEMQQYEQYAEEMRKLGLEFDTNAYEQSMKEQQDELDKYVTDTIQTIFNNMSAAEMAGQMDTVDEVDSFAEKYFNSIDTDIANMTRKQIQIAEQKLLLQTQTLERAREFVKNKGVVNKEMSVAQGYYVDGNGQPLISATTGGIIPMPVEAPMDPVFNEKTGQLVTFTAGENGEIIADVQQVIDMPTFGATTIANMAKAVANGTMTVPQALDVLPPASQQAFLDQIGDIKATDKVKRDMDAYGNVYGITEDGRKVTPGQQNNQSPQPQTPQGGGQVVLDEEVIDTGIPNVYGGTVKLVPTVANMVNNAQIELLQQGIELKIGDSHRSSATQANAYASGKAGVAPPGTSRHEHGQAIDISQDAKDGMFVNGQLDPRVKRALENAGLQQLKGEPRHWSYGEMGGQPQQQQSQYTPQQKNVLDKLVGKSLTAQDRLSLGAVGLTDIDVADYEAGTDRPLTKDEKKDLLSIKDDLKADPRRKEYLTLFSKIDTLSKVKLKLENGTATAQDKQQLINDFAKVLDPASVVRESEYTLAAKYGQSGVNKTIQDISNRFTTNGPLNDTSAKILAEALSNRYESSALANDEAVAEQMRNAEAFLGRKVKPEELGITLSTKTSTIKQPTQTAPTATTNKAFDDLRNNL